MQPLRDLRELHPLGFKNLLEVFVTVDELSFMRVLEFVGLHILPQSLNDHRPGLSVNPQQPGQAGVQLILRGLEENDFVHQSHLI